MLLLKYNQERQKVIPISTISKIQCLSRHALLNFGTPLKPCCYLNVISYFFKVYDYMLYIFIAKRVSLCAFGVGKCVYIHRLFMVKINIIRQFVQSCFIVYYHMLVLFWESVEHQNTSDSLTNRKLISLNNIDSLLLPLSILDS
jgi:hypothetical protein